MSTPIAVLLFYVLGMGRDSAVEAIALIMAEDKGATEDASAFSNLRCQESEINRVTGDLHFGKSDSWLVHWPTKAHLHIFASIRRSSICESLILCCGPRLTMASFCRSKCFLQ